MVARIGYQHAEANAQPDIWDVFNDLRRDVEQAFTRQRLNELYKRAGYLMTLTRLSAWDRRYGAEARNLRRLAEAEFALVARKINRRAKSLGEEAGYAEKW